MNVMPLMFSKLKQTREEVIPNNSNDLIICFLRYLDYRFQYSFISWFNNLCYFEYSMVSDDLYTYQKISGIFVLFVKIIKVKQL
jgi:hypothetical protein